MLALLINAEQFERFCHTKYPGTKRFSLEGSESLIPLLDMVLTHTARLGCIEAVLGMAHRGRLTAIEQILKRPGRDLFGHFEDVEPDRRGKPKASELMPQQRMLLELARNFAGINNRKHQDALCNLARVLANGETPE